ncbi:hypothetical protein H311_00201 [Anncaliia algerae PRA109]|nr:hypothetical protein H311_00201 [Anncaliia algerae PRA109]
MKFVQVGRVVKHRKSGDEMIITGILTEKFVIVQDANGERYKITINLLKLTGKVVEIKENSSVKDVAQVFVPEQNISLLTDFDRFKHNLFNKVKEGIINSRIN